LTARPYNVPQNLDHPRGPGVKSHAMAWRGQPWSLRVTANITVSAEVRRGKWPAT
jgi:hypothetical protein